MAMGTMISEADHQAERTRTDAAVILRDGLDGKLDKEKYPDVAFIAKGGAVFVESTKDEKNRWNIATITFVMERGEPLHGVRLRTDRRLDARQRNHVYKTKGGPPPDVLSVVPGIIKGLCSYLDDHRRNASRKRDKREARRARTAAWAEFIRGIEGLDAGEVHIPSWESMSVTMEVLFNSKAKNVVIQDDGTLFVTVKKAILMNDKGRRVLLKIGELLNPGDES